MKFTSVALLASTLLSITAPSVIAVPSHRFRPKNSSKSVTAAAASATAADVCSAGATATKTVFVTVGAGGIPAGIGGGNGNGGGAQETASSSVAASEDAVTSTSAAAQATKTKSAKPVVTTAVTTITREAPFTATVTVTKGGKVITTKVATTISSVETKVVTVTVTEGAEATETSATTSESADVTAKETTSATKNNGGADATATATATKNVSDASGTTSAAQATDTSSSDPQTSLRLDPRNIMKNLESDGNPGTGEIPSLTSSNNFINHCLTLPNVPLTNGQQIKTGSCNPTPMGRMLAKDKLPSSTFKNPPNFGVIPANTPFLIEMSIRNMVTGNFVNAQANYYISPAQTNNQGIVIGHTHVTIQALQSFDQPTPLDPLTFTFFKGINDAAVGGVVSTNVTGGVPPGVYRIASINSSSNHQPVLPGIEEHGSLDAFAYFRAV